MRVKDCIIASAVIKNSYGVNFTKEGNREQGIGNRGQGAGGREQIRNTHLHQFRASVKKKMFLQDA
jgi:hypothetical protein